jgi:hypothetical protein
LPSCDPPLRGGDRCGIADVRLSSCRYLPAYIRGHAGLPLLFAHPLLDAGPIVKDVATNARDRRAFAVALPIDQRHYGIRPPLKLVAKPLTEFFAGNVVV